MSREADGLSSTETRHKEYDGSYINTVEDSLIDGLPSLVKLCKIYINNVEEDSRNLGFLKIALDFYSQSLGKVHPTHQITYACLALEALYNTSSEKILKQLKERCAGFLNSVLGISKKFVIKTIQKAYEVRCSYVHGQNPTNCVDEDLVEKILDVVRYSIILFLALYSNRFFKKKLEQECLKLNLKTFVNCYYLDNLEIMPALEKEVQKYLKNLDWVNNLNINNDYCRYRDIQIDEFECIR